MASNKNRYFYTVNGVHATHSIVVMSQLYMLPRCILAFPVHDFQLCLLQVESN